MNAEASSLQNQESVTQLLKDHVQSQKDAIKVLERKAMHNLTIVNIIAGIVAALNLPFVTGEARLQQIAGYQTLGYFISIAASIVLVALCALVAALSIRTLWVRRLRTHPMQPTEQNALDWSACETVYFREILQKSYLQIYQYNGKIVDDKGSMVNWSHKVIVLIILIILFGSAVLGIEQLLLVLLTWFGAAS